MAYITYVLQPLVFSYFVIWYANPLCGNLIHVLPVLLMQIFVDILDSDAICICLHSLPLKKNQELARQMVKKNYYQRVSGKYAILKTFKNIITLIQGSINTVPYCAITVRVTLLQ